jgi:hypothetical protein
MSVLVSVGSASQGGATVSAPTFTARRLA